MEKIFSEIFRYPGEGTRLLWSEFQNSSLPNSGYSNTVELHRKNETNVYGKVSENVLRFFPHQKLYIRVFDHVQVTAEQQNFSLTEIPESAELEDILQSESSYFYLEMGNYRLIHTIDRYFPLQFAR